MPRTSSLSSVGGKKGMDDAPSLTPSQLFETRTTSSKPLPFWWHHVTLPSVSEKGVSKMKALFAFVSFAFLGTVHLAAQVIPPPAVPRRPVPESKIYLVTFRRETAGTERAATVRASGAPLRRLYTSLSAASVEIPDVAVLARLRNDPRVLSVFSNRPMTLLGGQGHSGGTGGGGGTGGAKPKVPTSLTATATSSTQITLTWTDTSGCRSLTPG